MTPPSFKAPYSNSKYGFWNRLSAGTLWVTAIRDDYIEFVLLVGQKFEAVTDVGGDVRVLETDAHAR